MTRILEYLLIPVIGLLGGASLWGDVIATNPDLGFDVNSNGVALTESIGNISLTDFNAVSGRSTMTFETEHGYSGLGREIVGTVQIDNPIVEMPGIGNRVSITQPFSEFDPVGFTVRAADGKPEFASSGDEAIHSAAKEVTFSFDNPVAMFGLVLNRSGVDQVVTVSRIGSADEVFSMVGNLNAQSGTNHSFFGFQSDENDIISVKFEDTNFPTDVFFQRSFDDVSIASVTAVPEPGSLGLLALGGVYAWKRRRNRRANGCVAPGPGTN
ncbi:PEP-CTERM sorting domain-containing protein [Crateriforma conspicua]|uniref:Ice-binding protein C-terminal domain-containing protein n=1 Tax=Crateriforma conspicua TaxID=2527996 RepID=A0A5C5Y2H5_9PLAN|nr:PEP-CTERM sorting domain-containing protein [Crateriforma conspicua]QDV63473.1 hypothetical protein Mal65_26160 [Crateriforma conspicua]TWT69019.1 hypothetical protein Pan14r_13030 [Crateriforma conspicua]